MSVEDKGGSSTPRLAPPLHRPLTRYHHLLRIPVAWTALGVGELFRSTELHHYETYCGASGLRALPPSLMDKCPEDVIEHILAHLEEDRDALRSCSLTCREFLYPSQRLLFRVVEVKTAAQCCRLLRSVEQRSELGLLVRRLRIVNEEDVSESESPAPWIVVYWPRLAPYLTGVTILTVQGIDFEAMSPSERVSLWTAFAQLQAVTEIYIYMCEFQDISEVGRLLHSFPALEETDFWWNDWDSEACSGCLQPPYFMEPPRFMPAAPLPLRCVSIGDCPNTDLAAWLMYTRSAQSLALLSFHLSDLTLVKSCAALMRFAGPSVAQLSLDCMSYETDRDIGVSCVTCILSGLLT
jgi:hypothetical protein